MDICVICHSGNGRKAYKKTCCKMVHLHCQLKWGGFCVVCGKKIKGLPSIKKYYYEESPKILSKEEIKTLIDNNDIPLNINVSFE